MALADEHWGSVSLPDHLSYPITTASDCPHHFSRHREIVAFALFVLPQSISGSSLSVRRRNITRIAYACTIAFSRTVASLSGTHFYDLSFCKRDQPGLVYMADLKPKIIMLTITWVLPRTFGSRLSTYISYISQFGMRLSPLHTTPTTPRH